MLLMSASYSALRHGREIIQVLVLLVALVAMVGCPLVGGGRWKPEFGIHLNEAAVGKTVLAELAHEVYDLEWSEASEEVGGDEPAAVIAVTGVGAFWLDVNGKRFREVSFDVEGSLFRTRTVLWGEAGSRFYAGLLWDREPRPHLVIVGDQGEVLGRIWEVSSEFEIAVLGDRRVQVVVEHSSGREIGIFEVSGRRAESFAFPFYVTDLATADFDGDDLSELLVYLYPSRDGGGDFQLLDGRLPAETWSVSSFSSFAVLADAGGVPQVLYPVEDGFAGAALGGAITFSAGCTNAHRFSYTFAASADDYIMIVVSGGGYLSAHMVCLFDLEGNLVYREVSDGHAYDLMAFSDGDDVGFLTNAGSSIIKYAIRTRR